MIIDFKIFVVPYEKVLENALTVLEKSWNFFVSKSVGTLPLNYLAWLV